MLVHFLTGNPSTRGGLKAESIGSATTTAADINYFKAQFLEAGVENIADPYKGRIPLPSVLNYQDQDLSCHLIQMGTNTPKEQESFHNRTCTKQFFQQSLTE
jgi:hypothetical protein